MIAEYLSSVFTAVVVSSAWIIGLGIALAVLFVMCALLVWLMDKVGEFLK